MFPTDGRPKATLGINETTANKALVRIKVLNIVLVLSFLYCINYIFSNSSQFF